MVHTNRGIPDLAKINFTAFERRQRIRWLEPAGSGVDQFVRWSGGGNSFYILA
jgi:hypothetical protein